jgi:isopenicillin N synthase-like dioxygenase
VTSLGTTLPVHPVDLAPFRDGTADDRAAVAGALDAACRDSGFLMITGHGVAPELTSAALDAFGAFFDLPVDEKRAATVADPAANRGYTELGTEGLAYSLGEETPPDLFEAFNVGREDAADPYFEAHRSFYATNVWPARPPGLRATWREYEAAAAGTQDVLLRAMAMALDLPEAWFVDRTRRAIVTTRAINYERAAGAPAPLPDQMRMGQHTDYGIITILLADPVPGLQVFRAGRWHDVVPPPGAFVCNIGDMLARWTNDRWTSTLHRVVPPPTDADGPVRRRSIARFLDCEPDLVVECIPSCASVDDPPRYEPVVAGEWLMAKVLGGRTREPTDLPQGGS